NLSIYSTNSDLVSGICSWTFLATPCHGVDQNWRGARRHGRPVEITAQIFVRQFGHRPCSFQLHDPAAAPLVPRAFRRLAARARVARAPPLPGRDRKSVV